MINGYVLGYKIPELVKDEKIKARKLSYDSQMYLLKPRQFLHAFSLNELVDISKIYAKKLSRIRGITSANLNTFSLISGHIEAGHGSCRDGRQLARSFFPQQ